MQSLVASCADSGTLASEPGVRAIALFDHEEVGSDSAQGAGSSLFEYFVRRVVGDSSELFAQSVAKSFVISADMAHAVHPNYPCV